jgi:hypothetical protein
MEEGYGFDHLVLPPFFLVEMAYPAVGKVSAGRVSYQ